MKRYFIWKDENSGGINPEWLEISGEEFYRLTAENKNLRFIHDYNEDDPDDNEFYFQVTPEIYREWDRDRKHHERQQAYLHSHYEVISFDALIDPDDSAGLTWADIIPDTSDIDAEHEQEDKERKAELISKMMEEINKLPEEDKKLIYALFLNPDGNMTETEYAESIGIAQQNVNKRKLKIFKKIRAAMGVKK